MTTAERLLMLEMARALFILVSKVPVGLYEINLAPARLRNAITVVEQENNL